EQGVVAGQVTIPDPPLLRFQRVIRFLRRQSGRVDDRQREFICRRRPVPAVRDAWRAQQRVALAVECTEPGVAVFGVEPSLTLPDANRVADEIEEPAPAHHGADVLLARPGANPLVELLVEGRERHTIASMKRTEPSSMSDEAP